MDKKFFRVVAFDETNIWSESIKNLIKGSKIWGIYAYDPHEQVRVCEINPFYELRFVGNHLSSSPELMSWLEANPANDEWDLFLLESEPDSIYVHCATVDSLVKNVSASSNAEVFESIEDCVEYWRCNGLVPNGLVL